MPASTDYPVLAELAPEPTPTHYCRYTRIYPLDKPGTQAGHTCQLRETKLGRYVVSGTGRKKLSCRVCDHHEYVPWIRGHESVSAEVLRLIDEASREEFYATNRGRIKSPNYLAGMCAHPDVREPKACLHQLIGTLEIRGTGGGKRA